MFKDLLRKPYNFILNKKKYFIGHVIMPNKIHKFFTNSEYPAMLKELKNIHEGERCFIIGNGPSLKAEDLDKLKNEYSFASNFIGKIFDKTEWRPTYFCVMDPTYVKNNVSEFINYEKDKMFIAVNGDNFESAQKYMNDKSIYFCEMTHGVGANKLPKFSDDVSKIMYGGYSVTYCLLQLAVHMGFKEIYIIGVDNNFGINTGFKGVLSKNDKNDHFYKVSNKSKGNVEGMTNAYIAAKRFAQNNGVKIYNATRGGKLEVFERIDFDSIKF